MYENTWWEFYFRFSFAIEDDGTLLLIILNVFYSLYWYITIPVLVLIDLNFTSASLFVLCGIVLDLCVKLWIDFKPYDVAQMCVESL